MFLRVFVASASGALSSFSAALRGAPGNDFWASLAEGPIDAVKALEFSDACGSVGEVFGVDVIFRGSNVTFCQTYCNVI